MLRCPVYPVNGGNGLSSAKDCADVTPTDVPKSNVSHVSCRPAAVCLTSDGSRKSGPVAPHDDKRRLSTPTTSAGEPPTMIPLPWLL